MTRTLKPGCLVEVKIQAEAIQIGQGLLRESCLPVCKENTAASRDTTGRSGEKRQRERERLAFPQVLPYKLLSTISSSHCLNLIRSHRTGELGNVVAYDVELSRGREGEK